MKDLVSLQPIESEGLRVLSHRPSVLAKLELVASEEFSATSRSTGGALDLTGENWEPQLKRLLAILTAGERTSVFAVPMGDEDALPTPAETVLARARSDWFPRFLSQGQLTPHFQPIV